MWWFEQNNLSTSVLPDKMSGSEVLDLINSWKIEEIINSWEARNETISIENWLINIDVDEKWQFVLDEKSAQILNIWLSWWERNLNSDWWEGNLNTNKNNLEKIQESIKNLLDNSNYQSFNENKENIKSANTSSARFANDISNQVEFSSGLNEANDVISEQQSLEEVEKLYSNLKIWTQSVLDKRYELYSAVTPEEKIGVILLELEKNAINSQLINFERELWNLQLDKEFFSKVQERFQSNKINYDEVAQKTGKYISSAYNVWLNILHNVWEAMLKRPNQNRNFKNIF